MAFLEKQKRSKYWQARYKDRQTGRLLSVSLKTTNKQVAGRLLRKYQQLEGGEISDDLDIDALIGLWSDYVSINSSPAQAKRNTANVDEFFAFAKTRDISQLVSSRIQDWSVAIAKMYSPKTAKNKLTAVRAFCAFLEKRDVIHKVPYVTMPRIQKLPPRFLTDDEYRQVLTLAKKHHCYLEVLTVLQTGMRLGELRLLSWDDVHFDAGLIVLPKTKTNRPRAVPMTTTLKEALRAIQKDSGPVFPGRVYSGTSGYRDKHTFIDQLKPIQEAMPEAFTDGMSNKSTGRAWHLLRHTFASRYVQAGGDIYRLAKILGHSNVTTTQVYAHLAPVKDEIMERI